MVLHVYLNIYKYKIYIIIYIYIYAETFVKGAYILCLKCEKRNHTTFPCHFFSFFFSCIGTVQRGAQCLGWERPVPPSNRSNGGKRITDTSSGVFPCLILIFT